VPFLSISMAIGLRSLSKRGYFSGVYYKVEQFVVAGFLTLFLYIYFFYQFLLNISIHLVYLLSAVMNALDARAEKYEV
jgi:hypothetical protein